MEYYSALQRGNPDICDNMDKSGEHCAKWDRHKKPNTTWSHLLVESSKVELIVVDSRAVARNWGRRNGLASKNTKFQTDEKNRFLAYYTAEWLESRVIYDILYMSQ